MCTRGFEINITSKDIIDPYPLAGKKSLDQKLFKGTRLVSFFDMLRTALMDTVAILGI